jgi:hypothetical protein
MRQQVVDLILNPRLRSRIPERTRRAVDSTHALMMSGKFALAESAAAR